MLKMNEHTHLMKSCSDETICRDRSETGQGADTVEVTDCSLGIAFVINSTSIPVHQNQQHFKKRSQRNGYSTNRPSDVNFKNAGGRNSKY